MGADLPEREHRHPVFRVPHRRLEQPLRPHRVFALPPHRVQ